MANGFDYIPKPAHGAAWVTGASAGIGRALTLRLAASGWTVYATARRAEELEALAAEAPEGSVRPAPGDVTDAARMAEIVSEIRASGPLALAVLNAGVYHPMRAQEYDVEKAAQTIAVNLTGVSNGVGPAVKAMMAQGSGCLALVASVAGYRGLPRAAPYSATKAGLMTLAESLAFDTTPRGVRVCVVNPGFVETEATAVNDFEMPGLMTPAGAAEAIERGLSRGGFSISFPFWFVFKLRLAGLLRTRSYVWLVSRRTD